MYLIEMYLQSINICIPLLWSIGYLYLYIITLSKGLLYILYYVNELHMIKHKYIILGNIILFKTITILFSVYNLIILSTLETSCVNVRNCLNPTGPVMSSDYLSLIGVPAELSFWRTLLKRKKQGGLSTREGTQKNHPFLVEEKSTPLEA